MPKLRYPCFISYRHSDGKYGERCIQEFLEALESRLEWHLDRKIYIDRQRLHGGVLHPSALARALCESACLVVIYWPTYFSEEHTYCTSEYIAMERLEGKRTHLVQELKDKDLGLIIPIVFCGENTLPQVMKGHRQYQNFTWYRLTGPRWHDNPLFEEKVIEIAEYITECFETLENSAADLCGDCGSFALPSQDEALDSLDKNG